jgi:hypothetical protein
MHKVDKPIKFPESTWVGRVIPKTKIYEAANVNSTLTTQFVAQVEQIKWVYKLSAKTLNIEPSKAVPEIQVFEITLKTDDLDEKILGAIDKAIPFPMLFKLRRELSGERSEIKYAASYKRQSQADNSKWTTSGYLYSGWLIENRIPEHGHENGSHESRWRGLPPVISMSELYRAIFDWLLPHPLKDGETLEHAMQRMEDIAKKEREYTRLQKRLNAEKQFNRKVEINRELRALEQMLSALKE